jgi:hypothetical protein
LDEPWVTLTDVSGRRDFCHHREGQAVHEGHTKIWKVSHPLKLMVAMEISAGGQTGLYIVPETVKVNGQFFIDHILRQIVENIFRLYPGEEHKVTIYMDSAGSHVCSETTDWMNSREMKCIPKQEWMSDSSDLFPMNFGINSIFKNLLNEKEVYHMENVLEFFNVI